MDILCTDKTGTLTEGTIVLDGALDAGIGLRMKSAGLPISMLHSRPASKIRSMPRS